MNKKTNQIIHDAYTEIYSVAESIDGKKYTFDELSENAFEGDNNKKVIPFMSFYVDDDIMQEIVKKYTKGKRSLTKSNIEFSIYLGPSPTSCREKWEKLRAAFESRKDESDWWNMNYKDVVEQNDNYIDLADALVFFTKLEHKNK